MRECGYATLASEQAGNGPSIFSVHAQPCVTKWRMARENTFFILGIIEEQPSNDRSNRCSGK